MELDPDRVARAKAKARLHVQAAKRHQQERDAAMLKAKTIAKTWGFTLASLDKED